MLKLRNSLTEKIEEIKPINGNKIGMYSCGPTVYGPAHIGNLRSLVFADILARTIRYSGYELSWVMNITDVDDKTIPAAKQKFPSLEPFEALRKFTLEIEEKFFQDMDELNVKRSDFTANPRPTEHIVEMQEMIQKLVTRGFAYESDGAFYFDIAAYIKAGHKYGRLLKLDLTKLQRVSRVEADDYSKESVQDFALWKAAKPNEPVFEISIDGKNYPGRPGWHIECSAMSTKYLGQPFDIHTGGIDLLFPHHEDEIAQAEGANAGIEYVHMYVHNEHLLVDEKKMSKSLGNIFTLADIKKKGFNPIALRYFYLLGSYRTKLNFTWDGLQAAENSLNAIGAFLKRVAAGRAKAKEENERSVADDQLVEQARGEIAAAFQNNLDTPSALRALNNFITHINKLGPENLSYEEIEDIIGLFKDVDWLFGLDLVTLLTKELEIPPAVDELLSARDKARADGDFKQSDALREKISALGYLVEDTPAGPRVIHK